MRSGEGERAADLITGACADRSVRSDWTKSAGLPMAARPCSCERISGGPWEPRLHGVGAVAGLIALLLARAEGRF